MDNDQSVLLTQSSQPQPAEVVSSADLYTLSSEQASVLFAEAGFPRPVRSINRWCTQGILDCTKDENAHGLPKHFITRESVEKKIDALRRLAPLDQSRPDMTGHDRSRLDMTGHDQRDETTTAEHQEEIVRLKEENLSLKIDKGARDAVIRELRDQIKTDREHFTKQIQADRDHYTKLLSEETRLVGELQTKLAALEAPKEHRSTERVTESTSYNTYPVDTSQATHEAEAEDNPQYPPQYGATI